MIKTAGANVSPREVEAAILDVGGLGPTWSGSTTPRRASSSPRVVGARRRHRADRSIDLDALRSGLPGALSAYKVPKRPVRCPRPRSR